MATTTDVQGVQMIALEQIRADRNIRELAEDDIAALAGSIELLGQITPAIVRADGEGFVLYLQQAVIRSMGDRRWSLPLCVVVRRPGLRIILAASAWASIMHDSRAHGKTAGLGVDRRVWTSKRVRTRTIARVAMQSRDVPDRTIGAPIARRGRGMRGNRAGVAQGATR